MVSTRNLLGDMAYDDSDDLGIYVWVTVRGDQLVDIQEEVPRQAGHLLLWLPLSLFFERSHQFILQPRGSFLSG